MKNISDEEALNGPGVIVGVVAWLICLKIGDASMDLGGNVIANGFWGIVMLAPAWIAATVGSVFFRKNNT